MSGSIVCCTLILHCFALPYVHCHSLVRTHFVAAALYAIQFNHVLHVSMSSRTQSPTMASIPGSCHVGLSIGDSAGLARGDPYLLISRSNGVLTLAGESPEVTP